MRRKLWLPLLFVVLAALGGLVATFASGNSPELGLDLQGGVSVVLEPTSDVDNDSLDQAVQIIRDRVDALGVAEPEITRQGDAVVVQLPGVRNRDRALELVGQTAELRFRPVLQDLTGAEVIEPDEGENGESTTTTTTGEGTTTTTAPAGESATTTTGDEGAASDTATAGLALGESAAAAQQPTTTTAPPATTTTTAPPTTTTTAPGEAAEPPPVEVTPRSQDQADAEVVLQAKDGEGVFRLGPTLATGSIVSSARAEIPQGQWQVSLTMKSGADGIDKFNEIAAQCFGGADTAVCPPTGTTEEGTPTGRLAIVLDGVVQSAPSINGSSFERDQISISGNFSEDEAKDLALVLRYGALPVELERQSVQTVSASLGEDSLRAGILAGLVGIALVALYMLVYYRALGLVMVVGVSISGALLYSIVSWLGQTQGLALTLAGVTGIIVSIGVTVDSYVVFFERLKDEVKAGRTLRSSTDRAFRRAFRTILAADISSFLGAAVLWWLTVGSVRGFAFFLGLSTVLDVVVAWLFTRPTVILLSRNRFFTDMPGFGVARGLATNAPWRRGVPAPAPAPGAGR